MFASDLVSAFGHTNGLLVLETKHAHIMAVLGSSFGQAPALKKSWSNVFNFVVPKGESGVIALQVCRRNPNTGETMGNFYFFIGVQWATTDEYMTANLERQWVPKISARVGTITESDLSVVLNSVVYTTGNPRSPQEVHVEDGNLICRFMNGNIDEDQFREEVGAPARERQLAEQLENERQLVRELREQLQTSGENNDQLRSECEVLVSKQRRRAHDWRSIACQFHEAVSKRWWQRKRLLSIAIQAFKRLSLLESEEEEKAATYQDRLR